MLGSITRACARHGQDLLISFQQLSNDWHADYGDSNKADGLILLGYGDYLAYQGKLEKLLEQGTHFRALGRGAAGPARDLDRLRQHRWAAASQDSTSPDWDGAGSPSSAMPRATIPNSSTVTAAATRLCAKRARRSIRRCRSMPRARRKPATMPPASCCARDNRSMQCSLPAT